MHSFGSYIFPLFSLRERYLAAQSIDKISVWDADTKDLLQNISLPIRSIPFRFSPNEHWIASASGRTIGIWDIRTGGLIMELEGHLFDVVSIDFSPNGEYFASSGADGTLRLWKLDSGTLLSEFEGHSDRAWVKFLPDNNRILSNSTDSTFIVWDAAKLRS